ncbi:mRNA interferase MazF (plasmid) [Methylomarinovum tepidoasis]|uniref:mRNA interferase MazF n=1 Tax=Methylomarinovum tepidoasis TaxID=2840183 RepID=A0AAU9C1Z3_9GAMM|nr:type II toxin-antitoxin system PemK/MazF family toxin [Methylomarinovum sp. IN45]BCX89998.1 mRNA interferase MazF [Methylomarinovum sp. IN45]
MRRGDVVVVAIPGSYSKPRPAVVVQSDLFDEHPSVTILPITSHYRDAPIFRLGVFLDDRNGLEKPSQIMVDKILTVPREKVGRVIGRLDDRTMVEINRALAVFLGMD